MASRKRFVRFGGGRAVHEQELAEEMAWHVDRLTEELEETGLAPEEARCEAERRFGDARAYRRNCHTIDARNRIWRSGRHWFDALAFDLRAAARGLRTRPAYAVVVVLTLALAIGANTTIFSLVDSVILKPLDLPAPDRLLMVYETERETGFWNSVSPANFTDWRAQSTTFSGMAAIQRFRTTLGSESEPERLQAAAVTEDFFALIGVAPALGRNFASDDYASVDSRAAILSDRLFRQNFGGDSAIIGGTITLDGQTFPVVGVMPPGFGVPLDTEVWLPLVFDFDVASSRGAHFLSVIGRLAQGSDQVSALAEMDAITRQLEAAYPKTNTNSGIDFVPLLADQTRSIRTAVLTLILAVAVVLLIACANIAGLALARAVGREREMALRAALGARGGRLVRQLFGEAALLALVGGGAGLLLAWFAIRLLVARLPFDLPRIEHMGIDGRILFFTWLVTVLCTLLFGLAPALRLAHVPAARALREHASSVLGAGRRLRLRQGLVTFEMALALVLLAACGLLTRSLSQLTDVDLGFRMENVLTFQIDLPESRYPDQQSALFYEQLLERLEALPGVRSAAAVPWLPLNAGWSFSFDIVGDPKPPPEARQGANLRMVSAGYFETLSIPRLAGRGFDSHDQATSPPVILVNQTLVDRYFADRDPIGQALVLGYNREGPGVERRIVGVVGDVRQLGPTRPARSTVYAPHTQIPFDDMSLAVRTAGDPMALATAVRRTVRALDPTLAIDRLQTLEERYSDVLAMRRFMPGILGGFAAIALVLSALGLYGVLSQLVAARTGELGVRRALGATGRSIVWLVLGRALTLLAAGMVFGLLGAWISSRLLTSLLFGVRPGDPLTLATVAALLTVFSLMACILPALRAGRVDPVHTLREQ